MPAHPTCSSCGGSLRHTGEERELHGGHHVQVFECGHCGREVAV